MARHCVPEPGQLLGTPWGGLLRCLVRLQEDAASPEWNSSFKFYFKLANAFWLQAWGSYVLRFLLSLGSMTPSTQLAALAHAPAEVQLLQ